MNWCLASSWKPVFQHFPIYICIGKTIWSLCITKGCKGQPRINIWAYSIDLESLELYMKFQDLPFLDSGEEDRHGGHFFQQSRIIWTKFSTFSRSLEARYEIMLQFAQEFRSSYRLKWGWQTDDDGRWTTDPAHPWAPRVFGSKINKNIGNNPSFRAFSEPYGTYEALVLVFDFGSFLLHSLRDSCLWF